MELLRNDYQNALVEQIYRFARSELNGEVRQRDAAQAFPHDLWLKCGEMAIQGLPAPLEHGGVGLNASSTALALQALGRGAEDGGLVFAICAHIMACVVPVWLHGSDAQKRRYLPALASGRLIAANAMTERESGSDVFSMKTRATRNGDGFVITGSKIFVSNGPIADLALVYASTDPQKGFLGGVTAFLVDRETPGFKRGQRFEKLGLRTCPVGELVFNGVRVGPEAVLGPVGGGGPIFAQSMDWERVGLAAAHVGEMERLLERAVEYARTRKVGGKRIGDFQAVSHKIADMKTRLEAARLLTLQAASQLDAGHGASLAGSIAKLFVSEALLQSALDTVQVLGGYGFMVEYDVERHLRDAIGGTLYSGTSEIQRNMISKWLGL